MAQELPSQEAQQAPEDPQQPLLQADEPPFDASDLLRIAVPIAGIAVALAAVVLRGISRLPSCWTTPLTGLFLVSGLAALFGALFAFAEVWQETMHWAHAAAYERNPTNYRATLICVGVSLVVIGPTIMALALALIYYR